MAGELKSNPEKIPEIFKNQKGAIDSELCYLERDSLGENSGIVKNRNYTVSSDGNPIAFGPTLFSLFKTLKFFKNNYF